MSNVPLTVNACMYHNTSWGVSGMSGDLLTLEIVTGSGNDHYHHRSGCCNIIILMDCSESMNYQNRLDILKIMVSILIFNIKRYVTDNPPNITIIRFNDDASMIWNSQSESDHQPIISELKAEGRKNIASGLLLAENISQTLQGPIWMVVLSDCRHVQISTISHYEHTFTRQSNSRCKVVTINIDSDVKRLENAMSKLTSEIANTFAYSCQVKLPIELRHPDSTTLVGDLKIGMLQRRSITNIIYLVTQGKSTKINQNTDSEIVITYRLFNGHYEAVTALISHVYSSDSVTQILPINLIEICRDAIR